MTKLTFIFLALLVTTSGAYASSYNLKKFEEKLELAKQGDADAQYSIGYMYEKGKGVKENHSESLGWYLKAAEQGLEKAQYKVGRSYFLGTGTKQDFAKAEQWLQKSSDQDYSPAQFYLGKLYAEKADNKKSYEKARKWLKKSWENGFTVADTELKRVERAIAKKVWQDNERSEPDVIPLATPEPAEQTVVAMATPKIQQIAPKPVVQSVPIQQVAHSVRATPKAAARKPVVQPDYSTRELLLKGGWAGSDRMPSPYLPSSINNCNDLGDTIICLSKGMKKKIGDTDIIYQVETTILLDESIPEGEFIGRYRNNILRIENPSTASNMKLGWQYKKHTLHCKVSKSKLANCSKDRYGKMQFVRIGS